MRGIARRILPACLALIVFLIATTVLTWPRVPELGRSVVDYGDPLHHIWTLDWIDHALLNGFSHLYDAPIYHGFPLTLAYDDIFIGPALLALPLTALTGDIDVAYNLLILLDFVLTAWCAFLLARHVTGSTTGALFAGMLAAFSSYTFAHLSHLNLLAIYPMPLALLLLHQVFDARRRLVVTALWIGAFLACLIWQTLNSFYYAAYLALAAGALTVWEVLVVRRWQPWPARWHLTVAALLLAAGLVDLGAVWLLSAPNRAVQSEFGFGRTLQEQEAMSAQLTDYFSVSSRNRTYSRYLPTPTDFDQALFPGFLALGLASAGLLSLVAPRRGKGSAMGPAAGPAGAQPSTARPVLRSRVAFYAFLIALGVLLSLGPDWKIGDVTLPLPYRFLWSLPGMEGLRGPRRLAVLALLGGGPLAAWGWRSIAAFALQLARRGARTLSRFRVFEVAAVLALLVVMGFEQWTVPTPSAPLPPTAYGDVRGEIPPAYTWLAAQNDDGVLVEFPIRVGDATRDFPIMYYQKIHHHPLLNGLSSYVPPLYKQLMTQIDVAGQPLTAEDLSLLQSLDVRYLKFHRPSYKTQHWDAIVQGLSEFPAVRFAGRFGADDIYTLEPLPTAGQLHLRWLGPATLPAGATVPTTITVTNPYTYPLLTRLQPLLDLEVDWQRQDTGQPAARTSLALDIPLQVPQGAHLFQAQLTVPSAPGTYMLQLQPKWGLPRYTGAPPSPVAVTVTGVADNPQTGAGPGSPPPATAAAAAGPGNAGGPLTNVPDNPYGVNVFLDKEVEPWKIDQTLQLVAAANVQWITQDFPWQEIEFRKNYFFDDKWQKSSWERFDTIMDLAAKHKLRVIARISQPPAWAKATGGSGPLKDDKDLAAFANALLDRYKGRLKYVQIWNGPNLSSEWMPGRAVDPAGYVAMLKVVYPAVKAAHPDAVILSAPLASTLEQPRLRGNMDDLDYWTALYQAGIKDSFDIASANAFGFDQPPEAPPGAAALNFRRVELLHAIMAAHGDGARAVWINQYAWNAAPDWLAPAEKDYWRHVTEQQQATWTVQGVEYARQHWPWAGVLSVWYFRQVGDIPPSKAEYYFRMVNPDFSPAPIYEAVQAAARQYPALSAAQRP